MSDDLNTTRRIAALDELRDQFVRVATKEAASPRWRGWKRTAVVLSTLCVAAVAIGAVLVFNFGVDRSAQRPQPKAGGFEASGPRYESLQELVAVSDLIVIGTVKEILPGEVVPDPEFPTQNQNVVVSIDETLKGSAPAGVVTIKTPELAFGQQGKEEWRVPGKRVVVFLSPSRETPGLHILANLDYSQTAYIIHSADIETAVGDDLGNRIAALTLSELRQAVREKR